MVCDRTYSALRIWLAPSCPPVQAASRGYSSGILCRSPFSSFARKARYFRWNVFCSVRVGLCHRRTVHATVVRPIPVSPIVLATRQFTQSAEYHAASNNSLLSVRATNIISPARGPRWGNTHHHQREPSLPPGAGVHLLILAVDTKSVQEHSTHSGGNGLYWGVQEVRGDFV
jgi:hypothetical protein